jgi:AcrR family transcriptional regulator
LREADNPRGDILSLHTYDNSDRCALRTRFAETLLGGTMNAGKGELEYLVTVSPQLEWIRPPRQARSRATLDRLLDATEALLAEKPWEVVGVADIVQRAESSVGAFYSRFSDKDALLNALHERFVDEAVATYDEMFDPERWQGASVSAIVRAIIAFRVRVYSERVGLLRAFLVQAVYDKDFRARGRRLRGHLNEGFVRLIIARRREFLHPEPASAAEFVARVIQSVLQQRVLFELEDSTDEAWSTDRITTELTHTCLAYLGVFPETAMDM